MALAIPCTGFAQDWIDEGSITSRQYQRQIREGNQIVATEFFTLEYSVQTILEESGGTSGMMLVCANRCNGKVHDKHEDCDDSCDDTCTEEHTTTVQGEYQPDRAAMRAATRAANALAASAGGSHSPSDWSSRVSRSLANLRREAEKEITWEMPHADACSGGNWWVGTKSYEFTVLGTMKKVGFRMSRGVRTPIDEVVGTHEQVVARAWIAQDEPHSKHTWEFCRCKPIEPIDWESWMGSMGDIFGGLEELFESTMVGSTGVLMVATDGEVVDPGESKITVKANDLNDCVVEIENGTGRDVQVVIPIGTIFESDNPAVQDMSSTVRSTGFLMSGQKLTLYVSVNPAPVQTTKGFPVRWSCINMAKKQPSPRDKFTIKPPEDDVLQRLGMITNASRLRGPHDQARLWIYTDKATIDEVNKVLKPAVSRGRYSTLLWEVSTKGGVDLTSRDYQRLLEPKLLRGIPIYDEATTWLIGALTKTKARDLARYVESNAKDLAGLIELSPKFAPDHLSTMVLAMADSDNEQVERAAVRFLQRVPEKFREALAAKGALRALSKRLASKDRKIAEEAVNLLMEYPAEYANDLLGAMWEQLPTDALKEKVRNHLGIEVSDGA